MLEEVERIVYSHSRCSCGYTFNSVVIEIVTIIIISTKLIIVVQSLFVTITVT